MQKVRADRMIDYLGQRVRVMEEDEWNYASYTGVVVSFEEYPGYKTDENGESVSRVNFLIEGYNHAISCTGDRMLRVEVLDGHR